MRGFGGRGGGPWGRFPGGPRARRGDVRAAILTLLLERPMHGYEMIRELESRSGGFWRPSAGSIYPTLQLLEDEGLLRSEESEGKRLYALTDAGKEEAERVQKATPPWQGVADEVSPPAFQLRDAAMQLAAAVLQVGHAGSDDQVKRALGILNEARRSIYSILGETTEES
ncbi:MAG: PadR family transcriptional regulator [Candidatus Dormibacteraeota bacterium]|nr:PadR family transcriptional regulator [Candidatus Dormibacteraeota bacterium]